MKELVNIQAQLKAPKNQLNKFGGYKYRSCEDIMEAVQPLLSENKCTLTVCDSIEMVGNRIYIKATATNSEIVALCIKKSCNHIRIAQRVSNRAAALRY